MESAGGEPSHDSPPPSAMLQNFRAQFPLPREKRLAEFVCALQAAEVTHIVDVRAKPYSSRLGRGRGRVGILPPARRKEKKKSGRVARIA